MAEIDAQFWQFSPHARYPDDIRPPTPSFVATQQIRIALPDKKITKDLLIRGLKLQQAISTNTVQLDGKTMSLATICLARHGLCAIHSPLDYWKQNEANIRDDPDLIATINRQKDTISQVTGFPLHPLSVFGNVTLDPSGRFLSADSIILTVFLHHSEEFNADRVFETIWYESTERSNVGVVGTLQHQKLDGWYTRAKALAYTIQYKFKVFPYEVPCRVRFSIMSHLVMFLLISRSFSKSPLVKSPFFLGFASVFLCGACFATTLGVLFRLGFEVQLLPWYIMLIAVDIATLENVFALSNVMLHAGGDMDVREKVSRGWGCVGVPMTATLVAELIILYIGSTIDNPSIQEFCLFAKVLLLVEYFLQLTFFTAILAIDIKRVELVDLANEGVVKHVYGVDKDTTGENDTAKICSEVHTTEGDEYKACVECNDLKTHRAWNAVVTCLIILTLSLFRWKVAYFQTPTSVSTYPLPTKEVSGTLLSVSSQFWETINPAHDVQWLQVKPPYLIVFSDDIQQSFTQLELFGRDYSKKALDAQHLVESPSSPPSKFRNFLYTVLQQVLLILIHLNVPCILISCALIGIIIWMTPSWREQFLLPILRRSFVHLSLTWLSFITGLLPWISGHLDPRIIAQLEAYTQEDVHLGAISTQIRFDKGQRNTIAERKSVCIKTLSGEHTADVNRIAVNSKHDTVVSSGQDGRIVLWDTQKVNWMLRLDQMSLTKNEQSECQKNPEYYQSATKGTANVSVRRIPSVRCAQIEGTNKHVVTGFDDGVIRVWDTCTGLLVHELDPRDDLSYLTASELDQDKSGICRKRGEKQEKVTKKRDLADRVIAVQFVGSIDPCSEPISRPGVSIRHDPSINRPQTCVVAVYKSGIVREWDIISGECINAFASGHVKDITALRIAECKPPYRKLGTSLVYTASKDGTVKCWERRLVGARQPVFDYTETTTSAWSNLYTIDGHDGNPITSIDAALPVGGMGVLVTGSSDGAVKAWNLENGDLICVLSAGGIRQKAPVVHIGGPLLRFSKLSADPEDLPMKKEYMYGSNAFDDNPSLLKSSNHLGAITQVVVKRYCENETGRGLCRGCDTCFGNGFLVASCSSDGMVHVWRLERCDDSHQGRCTLCSNNYHRKKYKRVRKKVVGSSDTDTGPITAKSTFSSVHPARNVRHTHPAEDATEETRDKLVDIEQLANDDKVLLSASFLGQIEQASGRGITFFGDMFLAGVRQRHQSSEKTSAANGWEAWFTHLKYYEPSTAHEDNATQDLLRIPVETVDLETDTLIQSTTARSALGYAKKKQWFGPFTAGNSQQRFVHTKRSKPRKEKRSYGAYMDNEDDDDGHELLPFSTVHSVFPLTNGLGCDYGNFVKLVYLDDKEGNPPASELCKCGERCYGSDTQPCCCGKGGKKIYQCCGGQGKHRKTLPRKRINLQYRTRNIDELL
ncbi:hypothetical protein EC973_006958 [Apophysomyces ossiformis]|uniref:Sterol regulatory element-binding protein cleavage-activating protein n=1 Tax=Apophysomyces ossiformis TaxID=679940 RepID=A0A8H7EQ36_9FUNG|nr:hypothetical protein EC973_006958 [Apophysomyces ossiformis]